MKTVGPTLDPKQIDCVRKKLEFGHYYVDQVKVYETEIGVEALQFHVEEQYEMFGTPTEGAKETIMSFTSDQRLVSLSGYASYTGIKGVQLSKLDSACVKLAEEQAKEQEQLDTAFKAAEKETSDQSTDNLTKSLVVGFVMLATLIVISIFLCFCVSKDLLKRINETFITEQ